MKRLLFFVCLVFLYGTLWGQHQIGGIVTTKEDGSPLPGVNVLIQGTTIGTSTDVEGRYQLNVPPGYTVVLFSFIGFQSQEIDISGLQEMNVLLKPDCIRCFFDLQEMGISARSGLLNTPVGGQFDLSIPTYVKQIGIQSRLSYQTGQNRNEYLAIQAGLKHLVVQVQL